MSRRRRKPRTFYEASRRLDRCARVFFGRCAQALAMRHRTYRSGSRWALWRWTDVPRLDGRPLLTNLHLVLTPWGALTLRWIHDADDRPDVHDHPCAFVSVLLRGQYLEATPGWLRWRRVRFVPRLFRAEHCHRIAAADRALTLCYSRPTRRTWGYWTKYGFVPWRAYDRQVGPFGHFVPRKGDHPGRVER